MNRSKGIAHAQPLFLLYSGFLRNERNPVSLINKFFKQPTEKSQGIVAIGFQRNGFCVAVTRYENNRPRLLFCDSITAPREAWPSHLDALVKMHRLERFSCHLLLSNNQYRDFSIESPQVNADEMKQALRWRIADLLDYPIEDALMDYYFLPPVKRANRAQMIEVLSCKNSLVMSLVQICKQAGLNVRTIDVQEMALRNLAVLLPENEQGVAIVHLQANSGQIVIEKQGQVFLSRRFDFDYQNLIQKVEDAVPAERPAEDEKSNLAVEIQRSLDYVENYYDIPPINALALVLMPENTQGIIHYLMIDHGITARAMDLTAIVEGDVLLNDSLQNQCAPVIGASLRRYVESLT